MIRTPLKYLLRGAEGESDKNGLLEAECVKHTQKSANDKCISLVMSNRAEQRARARLSLSHLTKNAVILFYILPWLCAANLLVPLRFHLARLFFVHFTTIGDELHLRSEK